MSLRTEFLDGFLFILINIWLYVFGITYNILGLVFSKYYKIFIKLAYLQSFILVCFTIWGATLANEMYELQTHKK